MSAAYRELAAAVLDELPVTDRVYHDLRHTRPLVEALLAAVEGARGAAPVLAVAPNAMLPAALMRVGRRVITWQVPGAMTPADRRAPLDELLAAGGGGPYAAILLPYVLEAAGSAPGQVLAGLRPLLDEGGVVVSAYRSPGGLETRLAGLLGRSSSLDGAPRGAPSFSWPELGRRRLFGPAELAASATAAGFRVVREERVLDRTAAQAVNALDLPAWTWAVASQALRTAVARLRETIVVTLAPLPGDPVDPRRAPVVTVVAAVGRDREPVLREQLAAQTYPPERVEVLFVEPGPRAANSALRRAAGEVVAFTDDRCGLPRAWLESGVAALRGWTGGVTGRVFAAGSPAAALLPDERRRLADDGWFSAANSFFRRDAVTEAGGFDERLEGRLGWDCDLARRISAAGWTLRFDETLAVSRDERPQRRSEWIRDEFTRSRELPAATRRTPAGARLLAAGLFASPRTLAFDLLVAGAALGAVTRRPGWSALALPWVVTTVAAVRPWPPRQLPAAGRRAAGLGLRHAVWLAGLVAGSGRARRLVL